MEIRNLKTFIRVAAMRNFTHAARELGYSQSNVSAQILQLEQEIGVPLFNRSGRTVSLTQFGEELLPWAQELCATAQKMENLLRSEDFLGGTVRVGMTDSISELLLEEAFLTYHRRFPKVQLEISLDTTVNLLERMRKGELDAACVITDPLPPTEWQIVAEREVPIVAAANPALPLARQKSVTLRELAEQELVMMETEAPYSIQFEQTMARQHLECKPVFRLQSAETALRVIEREHFVTVLPLYTVQSAAAEGRVAILPVADWHHSEFMQAVLHRSRVLTPQIAGFLEELRASLREALKKE